jgi:hypothetical protein
MKLTTPPPAKLSDLLELAIRDARRLDHALYKPMWMTWHQPQPPNSDGRTRKCMVCLAGAVIAGTLACSPQAIIDISTHENAEPESTTITDKAWRRALWAIDSAREGDWFEAILALRGEYPKGDRVHHALMALPPPDNTEFNNWKKLGAHLDSLGERAQELRELGL